MYETFTSRPLYVQFIITAAFLKRILMVNVAISSEYRKKSLPMIVAKYLTRDEAFELKSLLEKAGIDAAAKRQGLPRFLGGMMFHQVQVANKDSASACSIVDCFNEKEAARRNKEKLALETRCPRCESLNIDIYAKNLVEKIFYAGVTVRVCAECGMKWYT